MVRMRATSLRYWARFLDQFRSRLAGSGKLQRFDGRMEIVDGGLSLVGAILQSLLRGGEGVERRGVPLLADCQPIANLLQHPSHRSLFLQEEAPQFGRFLIPPCERHRERDDLSVSVEILLHTTRGVTRQYRRSICPNRLGARGSIRRRWIVERQGWDPTTRAICSRDP